MARRKIVYEPGELDRTRKNLGDIDREEARRMAEVLGGEVGIERAAPLKKPGPEAPPPPPAEAKGKAAPSGKNLNWAGEPEAPSRSAAAYRPPSPSFPVEQKWSLRVKIDFLSARGDFMVKTQLQAFLSLFRLNPDARDPVNAEFVNVTCAQAFSLVEGVLRSLKALLPPRRPELWDILKRAPYHHAILTCLASWSVQGLSDSLNRLQRAPSSVVMRDLLPFARLLFGPLLKLRDAVEGLGFKSAVNSAWLIAKEANPNDLDALTAARAELEEKMDRLYRGMLHRWIPVFMRFCADRMYEPEEFLEECKGKVLKLLDVSELEIIRPPRVSTPVEETHAQEKEEAPKEAEAQPEASEEPAGEDSGSRALPQAVRAGLDILDKLYPEAGMADLEDWPDLYPYFNQIYSLPRGLDLVSTSDPITQIVVLAHILDDLFHGLRAVKFGISQDEKTEDLNERISTLIGDWPAAWEDVLAKSYLPLLSEYCRLIETERESRSSPYAARREADLIWFKKRYYLPYLSGAALSVNQPPRGHDRPALFKLCAEIKGYLTQIAHDIDRAVKARPEGDKLLSVPTIANPLDGAVFEVENPTSKRIRQLLKYEGSVPRKFTNSALIYYSLAIITVLDYLMNNPRSWAYQASDSLPYRPLEGGATPYVDKMEKGPDYFFALQIEQMAVRRSKREAEARAATASAAMGLRLSKDAEKAGSAPNGPSASTNAAAPSSQAVPGEAPNAVGTSSEPGMGRAES